MKIDLGLDKRIDEVFMEYTESFIGNSVVFEGCLLNEYVDAIDYAVIRFVSGGRRYLGYEIDHEGAYVKGVINYKPYQPEPISENKGVKLDDETVKRIRELRKENLSQYKIAEIVGSTQTTVSKVLHRKGAYAE
nr:MAG TPA: putative transcriptional regulator [Caudoviricetes sp.]